MSVPDSINMSCELIRSLCFFFLLHTIFNNYQGLSWSCTYGSCIYNYLCIQCLSPLMLWVWTPFMVRCTRYNIMWQSLSVTCNRLVVFSDTPVSSTGKTDPHNITDILMTVALNTINQNQLTINNYLLLPQHKSLLSCVRITEQSTPQHTLLGWKCSGIGTGKGEAWESWVPSPSLPLSPLPQENTSCSLVTAITWDAPQDIWVTSHPNNASTIFAWKINVSYDLYYNFLYTVIQI